MDEGWLLGSGSKKLSKINSGCPWLQRQAPKWQQTGTMVIGHSQTIFPVRVPWLGRLTYWSHCRETIYVHTRTQIDSILRWRPWPRQGCCMSIVNDSSCRLATGIGAESTSRRLWSRMGRQKLSGRGPSLRKTRYHICYKLKFTMPSPWYLVPDLVFWFHHMGNIYILF